VHFIPEFEEQCPVINMLGDKDYRLEDLDHSKSIFFSPISPETSADIEKVFNEAVGKTAKADVEVSIPQEKRNISVPLAGVDVRGAQVAKFTFNDLCGTNMGRADYSVIAEEYHTIFVEGVPKFKPDLGAEFRRFVSLTDILYGKKVAVYMQSEVPTQSLFEAASMDPELDLDELWAFRRCSSMLGEMQSPKYHHMVWLMRNHMLQETALRL
jgi:predicted ATPase